MQTTTLPFSYVESKPFPYQPPSPQIQLLYELYAADEILGEDLLTLEYALYEVSDEELEQFLGNLIRKVSHTVSDVGKAVGSAAKSVGKVVNTVTSIIPSSVINTALSFTPMGMAIKAGLGAVSAVASGKNPFQAALRSLAADPAMKFLVDTGAGALRGENILKAAQRAGQAGISDVRESLRFATMVAPFVPGIGTGVAAALGAANALASGQPITEALIAAARNAVPGGAIAQTAFDMAANLAKGKNFAESALEAARKNIPGGPAAQAAFDAGLAIAKGKSIQEAGFAAAGRLLPKSPFAADALAFVKRVASGENLQKAALSSAGRLVLSRMEKAGGAVLGRVAARATGLHRELGELEITDSGTTRHTGTWVRKHGRIVIDLTGMENGRSGVLAGRA
jgi:hypothetical protein